MMFNNVQLPKFFIWLVLLTVAEILLALYLMPLGFYVAGTIATIWLFFVLELLLLRSRHFIRYLLLFLAAVIMLLITSII